MGVLIAGIMMTFAAFTFTSIWLQSVLGLSPIEAGLTGLPMSVMAFAVSAGIGRFLPGAHAGRVIGGGLLLIGSGGVVGAIMVHGEAGWPALAFGVAALGSVFAVRAQQVLSPAQPWTPPFASPPSPGCRRPCSWPGSSG